MEIIRPLNLREYKQQLLHYKINKNQFLLYKKLLGHINHQIFLYSKSFLKSFYRKSFFYRKDFYTVKILFYLSSMNGEEFINYYNYYTDSGFY